MNYTMNGYFLKNPDFDVKFFYPKVFFNHRNAKLKKRNSIAKLAFRNNQSANIFRTNSLLVGDAVGNSLILNKNLKVMTKKKTTDRIYCSI